MRKPWNEVVFIEGDHPTARLSRSLRVPAAHQRVKEVPACRKQRQREGCRCPQQGLALRRSSSFAEFMTRFEEHQNPWTKRTDLENERWASPFRAISSQLIYSWIDGIPSLGWIVRFVTDAHAVCEIRNQCTVCVLPVHTAETTFPRLNQMQPVHARRQLEPLRLVCERMRDILVFNARGKGNTGNSAESCMAPLLSTAGNRYACAVGQYNCKLGIRRSSPR
mmetsp:Transcript_30317/g.116265  ORF Transcript_30317/g.116265 Transcript_30317/m.116265 type:complete len:222 (-) Transcript_30317:1768-2433(-)